MQSNYFMHDTVCMPHDLALSSPATTGLFTLLGALIGAITGGTLAIVIEVLRRRWQREDATEEAAKNKHAEELVEKRNVYYQLLAKGVELNYAVERAFHTQKTEAPEQGAAGKDAADPWARTFFQIGHLMQEFEVLRGEAQIIASDSVMRLIEEWDKHLLEIIRKTSKGEQIYYDAWAKSPYHALVKAIRLEFRDASDLDPVTN